MRENAHKVPQCKKGTSGKVRISPEKGIFSTEKWPKMPVKRPEIRRIQALKMDPIAPANRRNDGWDNDYLLYIAGKIRCVFPVGQPKFSDGEQASIPLLEVGIDGVLEERGVACDNGQPGWGDKVAALVLYGVVADDRALGYVDMAVDDGSPNAAMPPDVDVGEDDAGVHVGVRVDAHILRDHAV